MQRSVLDQDTAPALSELQVLHHAAHRILRLFPGLRDDHAFAEREAVGFDDRRKRRRFQVLQCRLHFLKDLAGSRRDPVFLHQALGKDLAAFDDRGVSPRAEAGDALRFQRIDTTEDERIVRGHHRIVDAVFPGGTTA